MHAKFQSCGTTPPDSAYELFSPPPDMAMTDVTFLVWVMAFSQVVVAAQALDPCKNKNHNQEYKSFEIYAVTIKIYMTECHH